MKTIFFIFFISLLSISCKKENLTPTVNIDEMVDAEAMLKFTGNFMDGPYGKVSGKAEVFKKENMYEVKLADFITTNGPDLHVFLSKESMPVNFIDLGTLKSTNGNQVYSVSGMPDFTDYKYISIHCVAFNHLFGSALLK